MAFLLTKFSNIIADLTNKAYNIPVKSTNYQIRKKYQLNG